MNANIMKTQILHYIKYQLLQLDLRSNGQLLSLLNLFLQIVSRSSRYLTNKTHVDLRYSTSRYTFLKSLPFLTYKNHY